MGPVRTHRRITPHATANAQELPAHLVAHIENRASPESTGAPRFRLDVFMFMRKERSNSRSSRVGAGTSFASQNTQGSMEDSNRPSSPSFAGPRERFRSGARPTPMPARGGPEPRHPHP